MKDWKKKLARGREKKNVLLFSTYFGEFSVIAFNYLIIPSLSCFHVRLLLSPRNREYKTSVLFHSSWLEFHTNPDVLFHDFYRFRAWAIQLAKWRNWIRNYRIAIANIFEQVFGPVFQWWSGNDPKNCDITFFYSHHMNKVVSNYGHSW